MRHEYFNLSIPAPKRLAMMRADFEAHATKYPYCPENAKPKTWRDMRGTTHKSFGAYTATLSQGFNNGEPVWYCHTGEQFRDECPGGPDHRGWYTNSDGDERACGIVGRLPHGRFIAGYQWSSNGERVYYPEVFTDESDAAQTADEHARVFAESEFEDNARFEAMTLAENEAEEKEQEFKLAFMARHVSAEHLELAREALEELRSARDVLSSATRDYERC